MLASIAILSSTDHSAELIGFLGHRSPPIGPLFGPENIVWDLKPAKEIRVTHWASVACLGSQMMLSGPNKVPIGGERWPMDPMSTAKWSVDLKNTVEASIRVLNMFITFYHFEN